MRILSGVIAILLAGSILPGAAAAADLEKGAKIYYDFLCYSCHGYQGAALRKPLTDGLSGIMVNETVFITFLRQRADLSPALASNNMPNYSAAVLDDEQASALYAYIKTFKDNPPEVKDDPLMQQILDAAKAKQPVGE
jgi:cytochrome c553